MEREKILTGNYKRAFAAVCAVIFAAVMLLLIPIVRKNPEYTYSIGRTMTLQNGERADLCGPIELPIGIYSVRIDYRTEEGLGYTVSLTDETMQPPQVMQNAQVLAGARNTEEFHLWLLTPSENLILYANGIAAQEIYFDTVRITRTNQIWYCMILGVAVLGGMILAGIMYAAYHRVHKIAVSSFVTAGLIVLMTILLSRPFLMNWLGVEGDVGYHLERIDGVAESLKNGVFPMRLESNFPYGYGYADGILYGSALLYIPAILWLIGFPVLYCYNIFIILINFATILVSFYCFGKMFRDKYIGLLCSALYSFSLYRITVLFGWGCVGEGCAQIFMPLLLYGYYRLFTESTEEKGYRNIWILLTIGYSGILQSHTLSCELALIWTCILCIVNVRKVFRKGTFLELAKGAGASLLCNVWYVVPFLDYYISEDLLVKHLGEVSIQYHGIPLKLVFAHFFDWRLRDEQGIWIRAAGPGLIPMLAMFVFLGLAVYVIIRKKGNSLFKAGVFCVVLSLFCIVFSLKIFPWDWVQQLNPVLERFVSSLRTSGRFLNWGTLFMVPVFGYCLWYAKQESRWKRLMYPLGVLAVLLAVGTSSMYYIYHVTHGGSKVRIFDNNQFLGDVSGGEYLIYGTDPLRLSYGEPKASDGVWLMQYGAGPLAADFTCRNESEEDDGYVELPLFLYKGYHAYGGDGEELKCVYGENNVVRVLLPPGFEDRVSVRFVSPIAWRISECVSAAAWIAVAVYCAAELRKRKPSKGVVNREGAALVPGDSQGR